VGTARLTDRIPADTAVAASVSRREIRDVLQEADASPELKLDVVAGEGAREHATISMTWSREDLERILEAATGDDVVLTFDRNELAAALDDVEAHGLRTRAALFAVAAAGALGSGATIANAMVPGGGDGGGGAPAAATTQYGLGNAANEALQARSAAMNAQYGLGDSASDATVTDASTGGYVMPAQGDDAAAALQARSEGMNAQYGLGGSASDATVTDASTGGYATPSRGDDAAAAALQARSEGMNEQYGLTPGGQNDPAVQALEARGAALNAQYGLGDSTSDAIVTDASTGGGYAATPTASSGGIELRSPTTDEALLAGAALLTIAGAAFAARRVGAPRPA
jgi:hypothetical protein